VSNLAIVSNLGNVLCHSPAHIPLYLYPFLNTVSKNRPFEYLRLTSLGVIGALVKVRMAQE
jgi:CCR4-NOT transcription complex subunit 9